ncbi:MAG: SIS domain-containing protein [Peptoniphilaceae bacterium]|nr:SIS domain-containing protein [Peptoniphilaceae bacterium]MDY3738621.1 SIS domain-containing protein [Peptoniphilaceae bacterium]
MNTEFFTLDEIRRQPQLWEDTFERYKNQKNEIEKFIDDILEKYKKANVIFTGAGTSQYVGDTIFSYLKTQHKNLVFESIGTTSIVSSPEEFLRNEPTILVSFARSGNSPESVAAIEKAKETIDDLFQIVITCAENGALAKNSKNDDRAYLFLLDERTNDRGFAMTSSFSDMALAALLIFDKKSFEEKEKTVKSLIELGNEVVSKEDEIEEITKKYDYNRVVYVGSRAYTGLTREAQLKILELTAGEISTVFDSSMGLRHGPKSFINDKTAFFCFVSNNDYTRLYDVDIINEVKSDNIATLIKPISSKNLNLNEFKIKENSLEDAYQSIVYVVFAQFFAAYSAIKVGNDVDNPSKSGTVNRVVKGVTIH